MQSSLRAQHESCAALYGEITLQNGRTQQSNFHDYPVLAMRDMPDVEVHIVPSSDPPLGIGEAGGPAIAPAVVNAIFAASATRILRSAVWRDHATKRAHSAEQLP